VYAAAFNKQAPDTGAGKPPAIVPSEDAPPEAPLPPADNGQPQPKIRIELN